MINQANKKTVFMETYGWPMGVLSTDFGRIFGEDLRLKYMFGSFEGECYTVVKRS